MADIAQTTAEQRLARLRQLQAELSKIKVGGESGVLTLKQGQTLVRILPPVGNMDKLFYHQAVGYHMVGNTVVRCSEFTTSYAVKCPLCEVLQVLRRGGSTDKKLADKIRLSRKYWMNVIVRDEKDAFDTAEGPYILKAGSTIFERTRSLVNNPQYGLIDDVEAGCDLTIEKTGEGLKTEYQVNPRRGERQPLLAGNDGKVDWESVQKILTEAKDLAPVLMPESSDEDNALLDDLGYDPPVKVYTYERTVAQFGVHLETINDLPDIIEANESREESNESQPDGNYAQPQRGNTASRRPATTTPTDLKARIANIRNRQS